MKVTETRVFRVSNDESKVRAFASVTLDDCLVINSIQVVQGSNDLYIRMPSRKNNNGQWKEIVFPKEELRFHIRDTVLTAFGEES